MNEKQKEKLIKMLQERSHKIETIRHFDEYFNRFTHRILKGVINEINNDLIGFTNETLRLFTENPYEEIDSRYFAMVQLISENNRRKFYLDNTKHYPSLTFEGNEISGKIKVTSRVVKKTASGTEIDIKALDEIKTSDLLIAFIEKVYNQ